MNKSLILYRSAQFSLPLLIYIIVLSKIDPSQIGELLIPVALASFLGNIFNQNLDNYFSSLIFGKKLHRKHRDLFLIILSYKFIFFIILFIIWTLIAFLQQSWVWFFAIYTAIATMFIPNYYIAALGNYKLLLFGFFTEKFLITVFVLFFLNSSNYLYLNAIYFIALLLNLSITYYLLDAHKSIASITSLKNNARLMSRYKNFLLDARFFIVGKSTQFHTDFFKFFMGSLFDSYVIVIVDFMEKIINTQKSFFSIINNHFQYKVAHKKIILNVLKKSLAASVCIIVFNILLVSDIALIINNDLNIYTHQVLPYSLILIFTPVILLIGQNYTLRNLTKTDVAKQQILTNLIVIISILFLFLLNSDQNAYYFVPLLAEATFATMLFKNFYSK